MLQLLCYDQFLYVNYVDIIPSTHHHPSFLSTEHYSSLPIYYYRLLLLIQQYLYFFYYCYSPLIRSHHYYYYPVNYHYCHHFIPILPSLTCYLSCYCELLPHPIQTLVCINHHHLFLIVLIVSSTEGFILMIQLSLQVIADPILQCSLIIVKVVNVGANDVVLVVTGDYNPSSFI